jgi:hypothetical protein
MFRLLMVGLSVYGWADQFHYNNVIIGDRAAGLGGAYCAVSDDASGIVYNPAGLAFALSNDISGSANAFYKKQTVYKSAFSLPGHEAKDFTEESGGTFSPFVGAIAKVDHWYRGMVVGFGIFTPDSELKDQDDLFEGSNNDSSYRYHRTANVRANTLKIAVGGAARMSGTFAVGASLGLGMIDELAQVYQDFTYTTEAGTTYQLSNVRERFKVTSLEPGIGLQAIFLQNFSFGFSVRVPMIFSQDYESNSETTPINSSSSRQVNQVKIEKPFNSLPMETRFGLAWFASPQLLLSTDTAYYTASESSDELPKTWQREAVMNHSLGAEYYITPTYPVRFGIFTNNDAREAPSASTLNQESIDYIGASLYGAMTQPNSQISLGTQIQQGSGKAQKVGGRADIQDVNALAYSFGFSVSHNF